MLVWVFGAAPISIGHFPISLCSVWVRTVPISIGHFPCQFEFLGPHLYRSVISISTWVLGPHLYRSVIFHVSSSFLGPHLYRLVISMFEFFGTAPISIDHLSCQLESRLHLYRSTIFLSFTCQFEFFWDCTYIDRSFIILSVWVQFDLRPHIYQSVIFYVSFSLSRDRAYIDRSFILPISSVRRPEFLFSMTFRVILLTWLLGAYCCFIMFF